ncbi:MAG: GMC oxidoreductase [bacterium]
MQIDTKQLESGSVVESDVCIIGAGPAGTTLAQEFLNSDITVSLLESGGLKPDHRVQKLSEGRLSGELYEPIEDTHLRQLGGTANHWIIKMADKQFGYRYAPLKTIDFEKREGLTHSGWPITRSDLDPYYERAHQCCEVGPCKYGPGQWSPENFQELPLDSDKVVTDYFSFGPTRLFIQDFPQKFAQSQHINSYLNATVVELLTGEDSSIVETAVVKTFDDKEIFFKARKFVIAGGGYSTPRLLLASKRSHPEGLGNEHDNVGRYLMDHSLVPSGNFYPHDPKIINSLGVYDMRLLEGASILGKLSISDALLRQKGLRNFTATLFPMPSFREVDALWGMREIAMALKGRRLPEHFFMHFIKMLKGLPYVTKVTLQALLHGTPLQPGFGQGGWSKMKDNHKKYQRMELLAFVEQSPHPDNRVTLIDEVDELGCPKIQAHFQWPDGDLESIRKAQKIMANELGKTGLGRFEPSSSETQPEIGALGLHHILGTTRMGDDPKTSVVDKHCRVHSTQNLYIASSSVFTTGGYANPTLTILALSIRLADRLKERLAH